MSTLNDTDLFVIERSGTNYQVRSNEMSTLQDTDLFVVERSGTNYQVEAKDINLGPTGSIEQPVQVLTPLNGAGLNDGQPYQPLSTAITAVNAGSKVVYSTDTIASVETSGYYLAWNADTTGVATPVWSNYPKVKSFFLNGGINFSDVLNIGTNDRIFFYTSPDEVTWTMDAEFLYPGNFPGGYTTLGNFVRIAVAGGTNTADATLVSDTLPDNNLLTFPTSNNFDKFEVGDVVQGSTSGDIFNAPTYDTEPVWSATPNGSTWTNYTASDNITALTSGAVSIGVWQSNDLTTWTRTDVVTTENLPRPLYSGDTYTYLRLGGLVTNQSATLSGAKFAGVKITAIDPAGPTITTDGGSWYGADGTGDAGDGRFEPSQQWSDFLKLDAASSQASVLSSASYGFNGDLSNWYEVYVGTNGQAIVNFNVTLTGVITLEFLGQPGSAGTDNIIVTGVGIDSTTITNMGTTKQSININSANVSNLKFAVQGDNNFRMSALYVNGKLLVDSSIPGERGETTVTKTVTSDASLTFNSDLELANMVGPLSQVDENGDVKTPVTSEIANVGGMSVTPGSPMENYNAVIPDVPGETGPLSNEYWTKMINSPGWTSANPKPAEYAREPYIYATGTKYMRWNFTGADVNTTYVIHTSCGSSPQPYSYELTGNVTPANGSSTQNGSAGIDAPLKDACSFTVTQADGYFEIKSGTGNALNWCMHYTDLVGAGIFLTFATPNPDLQFFSPGDQVGTESGFTPVIYTGNGTSQSLNCGFSPDLVWIKSRTATYNHLLFDSIRGAGNSLSSNATGETVFDLDTLSSFDSDGFSIGSNAATNSSNIDLVAWCWDAGDSTVTNNDGSIESQVRAGNGFSIVTYTGNLSSNGTASVGHGLGKRPSMIITKSSDTTSRWPVMHTGLGDDDLLVLSEPDAKESYPFGDMGLGDNSKFDTNYTSGMNTDGANFVAYCWAETPGVSSFGEYAGTSTANSIECGFKPGFVLIKASDADRDWFMFDSARSSVNPADDYLLANSSDAEVANNSNFAINFTDTGFTINGTDPGVNSTGYAYIYAAFAGSNPIEVVDVDVAANTMTVDGGEWGAYDQSQEWSAGLSTTGGSVDNPTQAFNGDIANGANGTVQKSPIASTLTFTLPAGLKFDGKVEAWLQSRW